MSKLGTAALADFSSVIESLEKLRKKTKQSKTIVSTGIVLVCVSMVVAYIWYYIALFNYGFEHASSYDPYGPMGDAEYWNIIWIFMGAMALISGPFIYLYIQNQKTTKAYQDQFYNDLISPLIKSTYPDLNYQTKGKVHNNKVVKSLRYKNFIGVEQRLCKHYISGKIGSVGLEIGQSNIKAVSDYKTQTASNKTGAVGRDNFFRGVILHLNPSHFNRELLEDESWKKAIQGLQQYWGVKMLVSPLEESVILDFQFRKSRSFLEAPTEISLESTAFSEQLDQELGLLLKLAEHLNSN